MQCPICGFYNMRGTERCVRCRSRLFFAKPPDPAELVPPRAGWTRHFRFLSYGLNRILPNGWRVNQNSKAGLFWGQLRAILQNLPLVGDLFPGREIPLGSYTGLLLSALPGLGHLCCGRRLWNAAVCFSVWILLLLLVVVPNVPTSTRLFFVALLFFWHGLVGIDASAIRDWVGRRAVRIRFGLGVVLLVIGFYMIPYLAMDIRLVGNPYAIKSLGLEGGETLVVRRIFWGETPRRGDLVTLGLSRNDRASLAIAENGRIFFLFQEGTEEVPKQVLAFPGEEVVVDDDGIKVNGRMAFTSAEIKARFGNKTFRKKKYSVNKGEVAILFMTGNSELCFVKRSGLECKAVLLYQPWQRSHWLGRAFAW